MATTISPAATLNVTRIPVAMASGLACKMSVLPAPNANTAPINEAPVINPRLRDRPSNPEMTPRLKAAWHARPNVCS